MGQLLLQNGTIVYPDRIEQKDILIDQDKIIKIGKSLKGTAKKVDIINLKEKLIFPGFIDMHVHLRQPGEEEKEDLSSGLSAITAGSIRAFLITLKESGFKSCAPSGASQEKSLS